MNESNKTDWSKLELGALWKRKSATQTYLSGYVKVDELGLQKEVKVIVFSNKNKKNNEKAPDFRIYLSVDKNNSNSIAEKVTVNKNASPTKSKVTTSKNSQEIQEEDLL